MLTAFQAFLALTVVHTNETQDNQENLSDEIVRDNLLTEEAGSQKVSSGNDKPDELDSEVEQGKSENSDKEIIEEVPPNNAEAEEANLQVKRVNDKLDGARITKTKQSVTTEDNSIQLSEHTQELSDIAASEIYAESDESAPDLPGAAAEASRVEPEVAESEAVEAIESLAVETVTTSTKSDGETSKGNGKPLSLGVIDEVYDFVKAFHHSQSSNVESATTSTEDSAGGVKKAAIFEHPRAEGDARIDYKVTLPHVKTNENLILYFSIGLRDGVDFECPHTKPDGVQFVIEIAGERRFECVSVACQWDEHIVDLSDFAGSEIQIAFLTNCNHQGNVNYDWALWGSPRILKLTRVSLPIEKGETEPKMRRGIVTALLAGDPPGLSVAEFDLVSSTLVSEIAADLSQRTQAKIDRSVLELGLYTELPKLEITTIGPTVSLIAAREDFELQCIVRNNGLVPLEPIYECSVAINRIKLRRGRSVQLLKVLKPGEETTLIWNIRSFSRESIARASISLRCQMPTGEVHQYIDQTIAIQPAIPKISSQAPPKLHTHDLDGHVITENKNLRAVFVRGNQGFEYYLLFAAKNGRYRQVAVSNAISEIRYRDSQGNVQHTRIIPSLYRLAGNNRGESFILLSSKKKDADGVLWSYEASFSLSDNSKRIKVEYRLATDGDRELVAFNGPMLHVGEGTFGESKTAALFPGLEFLEADEPSSSTRDAVPPLNNRLVPHPYKITIPLMAVEHEKTLVGLVWDALQTWDGKHNMLSSAFASPNWYAHQKNHLMGLFLPPPPDWVEENHLEASTPYPLKVNQPLTLKAQIIIDGNASILEAVSHWTDVYGVPQPVEAPRTDEEERLLSRHGFMNTVWDAKTRKSRHCVGWTPGNAPGFATLLWYDYLVQTQDDAVKDESVKERVLEITKSTIRESGKSGLISFALCHILKWESPFYFGHVEAGLDRLKVMMQGLIDTQGADGSWRFHPTTDRAKTLGREGDAVLGTCAHSALMLLKHARVTGDQESLEAGIKALKFMERFKIPRGAQSWECPLHAPDILATAHAIGVYVEAYEVTNERHYLEWAEYWATAGLPFLYHWHLPDRPGMRFASIPVFGTTFHTHPWFGVPVQWNGLVYAYYLQHLARHMPKNGAQKQLWSTVSEGITVSAIYQQWAEGELKGTYPDSFYRFCTERRGPHINPEGIMVNLYTLRGLDPDISTAILHPQDRRIHLSSGAQIESFTCEGFDAQSTEDGWLNFTLRYVQHETSYAIITGYGSKPSSIRAQNEEIPAIENLESVEFGWLYREKKDIIFIKYKHPIGEMAFEVLPLAKAEPESKEINDRHQ